MSCTPANGVLHAPHSMISIISPSESEAKGEIPVQRRGSRAYQIFPESRPLTDSDSDTICEEMAYRRERLPSIVVEPTEQSEVEGGLLHWALHQRRGGDEEDSLNENSLEGAAEGQQQEDAGQENISDIRKSSIGPSQSQLDLSRLTPPTSPTAPEAVPPCQRN